MLAILIFSWIVSVLFVVLAERNNGYSSSLSHKQREERLKEEGRRLDRKRAALRAKHKEEHRIWMELMGFAKEEEKKKLIKTSYNNVFFQDLYKQHSYYEKIRNERIESKDKVSC